MINFYNEKDYHKLFNEMIERLTLKRSEQIFNVQKAFNLAKELHKTQFRKSGDPYILHPVIVATILEKLDFDTDVISGALLHDVVEDCDYSVEDLRREFNNEIAEIVDGVTAITNSEYKVLEDSIFDSSDFLKPSMESQTYHKLLKIGKKNRLTFYIKFADRLHNLKTIDAMAEYKRLEKVKETEKWILPFAELLKSSFFYYNIKNECFKIVNERKIGDFKQAYDRYMEALEKNNNNLREQLFAPITNFLAKSKQNSSLYKIITTPLLEEQVYNNISEQLQIKGLHNIKATHLLKVPVCDIYIVLKNEISSQQASELLLNLLEDKKIGSMLKIIGFETDTKFNANYVIVSDTKRNKYRINLLSYANYLTLINGSVDGTEVDLLDEENSNDIVTEFIKVKTRSNEVVKIPAGSTLLDFAFKIHNDIGFSFKYGTINNSPSKFPHYTKLKDGDKVNIVTEKDPDTNELKYVAQIRWLAYVKTENAKKALIRYFEKKYPQG